MPYRRRFRYPAPRTSVHPAHEPYRVPALAQLENILKQLTQEEIRLLQEALCARNFNGCTLSGNLLGIIVRAHEFRSVDKDSSGESDFAGSHKRLSEELMYDEDPKHSPLALWLFQITSGVVETDAYVEAVLSWIQSYWNSIVSEEFIFD